MAAPARDFLSPIDACEVWLASLAGPYKVLVAVSGGSDSVGLLVALHQVFRRHGISERLVAATVDHELRAEAAAEAEGVARLCAELSVPHRILRWQGDKPGTGISAAAREARYRLLMEAADILGADMIVTGHTFDDQAETVAMRAARSEAKDNIGLAGMADAVLIDGRRWMARPFLATRREDIRLFLGALGRSWTDDPSNLDDHYERVRVRASLSGQGGVSAEAIALAGAERTCLAQTAAEIARQCLQVRHSVLARFPAQILDHDRNAVRYLMAVVSAVLGGRQHLPARQTLDRVMMFIEEGRPGRVTAGRVIFDRRREDLLLYRESRDLPQFKLGPHDSAIWDGRYRIINRGTSEISVGPNPEDRDGAISMFPDAPPAVALRAMTALPRLHCNEATAERADKESVIATPVLAPYDRFLPQFDFILGSELAVLFGSNEFPASPIKVFERKS